MSAFKDTLKVRRYRTVTVPEWGITVWVRPLTAQARMALADHDQGDNLTMMATLVVRAVTDEAGQPLMDDDDIPDLLADGAVFERLLPTVIELNTITKESVNEAKKN